jgi:sugar/nucleoside kinase (ribokinase family)
VLGIRPGGERPALHALGASLLLTVPETSWDDVLVAPVLHLGGVGALPMLDGAPAAALLAEAKRRGIIVTCDLIAPGPATLPALEAALPFVDYFMPTLAEARTISGREALEDVAAFYFERGTGCCVFKDGANGCRLVSPSQRIDAPAYRVNVVDTTGCGDAFCAGFGAARARGLAEAESARFACATAALVATGLGTDTAAGTFDAVSAAMVELPPLG